MTEEEWYVTRAGFHSFEEPPLRDRLSARQVALLTVAWLGRFERFWAAPTAFYLFAPELFREDSMQAAVDFLNHWADGATGPHGWGDAVKDAREAAHFARVLYEDLVEDNDAGAMQFHAAGTEAAADVVDFVCELLAVCGTPDRKLADPLAEFGTRSAPSVPTFVTARERRPPRFSSPQQRALDQLESVLRGLSQVAADAAGWRSEDQNRVYDADARAELALMHEVFGNPFRPIVFSPEWRTDTATALARQMYDARDFSAMPILADALQDAGCDNADILAHCRDAAQVHVRGCWVVDLVLGKE